MREAFLAHLQASGLIPVGARVLVGYSGGADSTCLLHLLRESGVDVVAGHLHHGQRQEADTEAKLCEAFCQELDIPFVMGRADVPTIARDMKIGLEEAGRHARYEFFRQAAFRLSCPLIATAHTRSDRVETLLLNLARGTGLAGLAGVPERRENIVRPLLPFSRKETRAYCDALGLWTHDDPANHDLAFSRARIRHRVLPDLQAINPEAEAAMARLSELAREEDAFLDSMAASALEQAESPLNGDLAFLTYNDEAAFVQERLGVLPLVLVRRALRLVAATLGASLDAHQVGLIVEGLRSGGSGSVTAEGGRVAIAWDGATVHARVLQEVEPFRFAITLPGETFADEFGWQFTAETVPGGDAAPVRASLEAMLDASQVKGSLHFRSVQPGDRMRPLGFDGHRKLADLLSEAGLTQSARRRLPIVCDLLGPVWAPGVCLDQRAAARPDTSLCVRLRFGPIAPAS